MACLFADLWMRGMPDGESIDLSAELRMRGFARGDTERMRLVLEALPHLIAPSRRTRRLIHRPYFDEARAVFEIVAPTCVGDSTALASFLNDPDAWLEAHGGGEQRRAEPRDPRPDGGGRRRRRGRRGGRSRHRRHGRAAAHALDAPRGEARAHSEGAWALQAHHAGAPETSGAPGLADGPTGSPDRPDRPRG
jgi:hypothetical protein